MRLYVVLDNETLARFTLEDAGTASIVPLVGKDLFCRLLDRDRATKRRDLSFTDPF